MVKTFYIINSRGEKEAFSFNKVYNSARRVGASSSLAEEIATIIKKEAYSGIKTLDIFKKVKRLLTKKNHKFALRFSLKEGMRRMGPTGFLFEKYVGEIFKKLGFSVQINQHPPGYCVPSHEIDFIARKAKLIYIGECKYRNLPGERVHLKDALANFARYIDVLNGPHFKSNKYRNLKIKTMMVTNTKFTSRTKDYSYCMGVELLGWNWPKNRGLERLIEKEGLYPVTILPSLRRPLKDILVSKRMMLVQDVLKIDPQKFSKKFKIPVKHIYSLGEEVRILLGKQDKRSKRPTR